MQAKDVYAESRYCERYQEPVSSIVSHVDSIAYGVQDTGTGTAPWNNTEQGNNTCEVYRSGCVAAGFPDDLPRRVLYLSWI
jgi:hypothetical protein